MTSFSWWPLVELVTKIILLGVFSVSIQFVPHVHGYVLANKGQAISIRSDWIVRFLKLIRGEGSGGLVVEGWRSGGAEGHNGITAAQESELILHSGFH